MLTPDQAFMRAVATSDESATGDQVRQRARELYEEAQVVEPFDGVYPPHTCTLSAKDVAYTVVGDLRE